MMMRDGAAGRDQRVAGRILDRLPLFKQRAVATAGVEGEIGCGSVRIDVREAAGDLALLTRRVHNRTLGGRLDLVVKAFESLPGDGGLERIVDEARGRQEFARIGHSDERVAPDAGRAL